MKVLWENKQLKWEQKRGQESDWSLTRMGDESKQGGGDGGQAPAPTQISMEQFQGKLKFAIWSIKTQPSHIVPIKRSYTMSSWVILS